MPRLEEDAASSCARAWGGARRVNAAGPTYSWGPVACRSSSEPSGGWGDALSGAASAPAPAREDTRDGIGGPDITEGTQGNGKVRRSPQAET